MKEKKLKIDSALTFHVVKSDALFLNFLDETRPPFSMERFNKVFKEILNFQKFIKNLSVLEKQNIRRDDRTALIESLFQGRDFVECHYCGTDLTLNTATFDHVEAHADGGSDSLSNMVLACQPCNVKKSDLLYQDFILNFTHPEPLSKDIKKSTSLIEKTRSAMEALEPSKMRKLDEDCPLWFDMDLSKDFFPKISPSLYALLSAVKYIPSETDEERNFERLQILLRIRKKNVVSKDRFLIAKIPEKDWAKICWYEFQRDFKNQVHKDSQHTPLHSELINFRPCVEKSTYDRLIRSISGRLMSSPNICMNIRRCMLDVAARILQEFHGPDLHLPFEDKLEVFSCKKFQMALELVEYAIKDASPSQIQQILRNSSFTFNKTPNILLFFNDLRLNEEHSIKNINNSLNVSLKKEDLHPSQALSNWSQIKTQRSFVSRALRLSAVLAYFHPQVLEKNGFIFSWLAEAQSENTRPLSLEEPLLECLKKAVLSSETERAGLDFILDRLTPNTDKTFKAVKVKKKSLPHF